MKKFWKIIGSVMMCCVFLLTGCGKDNDNNDNCQGSGSGDMTLEQLNAMLNDSQTMNMDYANTVAIVPFNHVNGPRDEWKFYALINFEYEDIAEGYVKYQVTYLSCTCRTADVNYWSTAYIELDIPESGEASDIKLQKLSFDLDGTGHYIAGYWGDSSPIYSGNNIVATYEKTENPNGGFYPSIKEDYIPLLVGKTKAELDQYNFVDDLKTAGVMSQDMYDSFTGASVSTNNILRILHAVFKYHASEYVD